MPKYAFILMSLCFVLLLSMCVVTWGQDLTEADRKIQEKLGEQSRILRLWPEYPPDEPGDIEEEKIEPAFEGGWGERIENVTQPSITVRRPEDAEGDTPAVLVSPGGAYNSLAFEEEGVEIVKWLNSLGVTGVLMKYRVPRRDNNFPKYHHALQDAQRAVGLIRLNAEEWGIDPNQVGVLGFSAGGHLSALLSNNHQKRLYDSVDEADEESCRPDFAVLIYPAYLTERGTPGSIDPYVVAEELSLDRPPPTFVAVSQMDGVMRGCMAYLRALTEAEVPAEFHVYMKGRHGGGLRPYPFRKWGEACARWMNDVNYGERK